MTEARVLRTVCDPNCHANPRCGILARVEDGRISHIEAASFPRPEYDKRICLMGMSRLEYQYHQDRILFPLRRTGRRGEGKWQRIGWDEAFELLAGKLREIAEVHGSRSVAIFSGSGAQGVLTKGSSVRFAALLGATASRPGGVDYGVPKGLEYTFGVPASTYFGPGGHEYADAVNSRLILLWGGNDAETRFVDYPFLQEAQRRGATVVCIDPNRTLTAKRADLWISLRPGTDVALALSLLGEIFALGLQSSSFLRRYSNAPFLVREDTGRFLRQGDVTGARSNSYMVCDSRSRQVLPYDQVEISALAGRFPVHLFGGKTVHCAPALQLLRDLVREYSPERAAEITGIPAQTIRDLAREFATRKPSSIRMGYGVDRWYYSDYTARAVAALAVVTGNIGVPGGGISLHSGTYPVPLDLRTFRSPGGESAKTLDVISLLSAIELGTPYPVKALWLSASNLFNQPAANRGRVMSAVLPQLEFIVVSDHFMTASAEVADLVLPACTIFEKTDLVPGIFLQLQQKVVEPEGESKSDFDIFAALAERMGFGEYFRGTPEDYLEEMLAADHPMLEGISLGRLRREGAVFLNRPPEPYVSFQDRDFDTPSGKIELYKEELVKHGAQLPVYREPIEASRDNPLSHRFPLTLLFSHSSHRIHSTFANMPMIKKLDPEPVVDLHPADAGERGIGDGQLVRVYNDRGSVSLKCRLNSDLRSGVVVISEGYWVKDFREGDPYSLTHDLVSPTSENYAFYDTLVEVEKNWEDKSCGEHQADDGTLTL